MSAHHPHLGECQDDTIGRTQFWRPQTIISFKRPGRGPKRNRPEIQGTDGADMSQGNPPGPSGRIRA